MAVRDDYAGSRSAINAPAHDAGAITPADDTLLPRVPKAVHCAGSTGTLVVKFRGRSESDDPADWPTVTFHILQGDTLWIRPDVVMEATTATGLVALF